jgi:peptidoglycan/xylan/chitin deacetylase (PgdA/CDA1 family)
LQAILPASVLIGRAPLPREDRRVALSFDDGPDTMTPRYLDALDALGISATFFLLGEHCARFPEHLLEIVRRGHEVASHGYSHRHFPDLTFDELRAELSRTHELLPPTPRRPMVRPPRGALSARSLGRCARLGYTTAMWSVDSQDYREKDPERVARAALPDDVRAGDVVLLHEGQSWTLDALPSIRRRAQERGFELCTMGALFDASRAPAA